MDNLNRAFSPSAPITSDELFSGRYEQIEKVCDSINERGQHFVVYGARGVGKTSLANIINTKLANVVVAKVTCNKEDNFKQLWQKALSKVNFYEKTEGIGFVPEKHLTTAQLDLFLPNKDNINSLDIQSIFENMKKHLCFVFDEFDRIESIEVKSKFADTIKALSDNASYVTVGVVGIASNVEDLIGSHPSLERCLKQISMPIMSKDELSQIVNKGLKILELKIDNHVKQKIIDFSSGFPHYTHLLSKHSAKECIYNNKKMISSDHYRKALDAAIEDTNQSVRDAYQKGTIVSKAKSKFEDVIAACALSEVDEYGTFSTSDIVSAYYLVTGRKVNGYDLSYNVKKLCERNRGSILKKFGKTNNVRYGFTNPLMMVYVKMKLDQKGSYHQPSLL